MAPPIATPIRITPPYDAVLAFSLTVQNSLLHWNQIIALHVISYNFMPCMGLSFITTKSKKDNVHSVADLQIYGSWNADIKRSLKN